MRKNSQRSKDGSGSFTGGLLKLLFFFGAIFFFTSFTYLEVCAQSTASVTLTWTAPGDDGVEGTASVYDIRYATVPLTDANWDAATEVTGEPVPQAAGSSESMVISGLDYSTTYYFAMKVGDEMPNWSSMSNVVTKATPAEPDPPAVIADLSVSASLSTGITLTWTAPGDDGSTGTASEYEVRYSHTLITEATWSSARQVDGEPTPQAVGNTETFTVTGLNPNTTYYFAVKAADEVPNWSGLSNVVTGTTGDEEIPPENITSLAAAPISDIAIRLTWTAPGDDADSGMASTYDIRYAEQPITGANWDAAIELTGEPSPGVAGSGEALIVSGLEHNTQYYFAIKTADEIPNWSDLSNIANATTYQDQTPPAAVNDLSAESGENTGDIDLSWSAPGDDSLYGQAASYFFGYATEMINETNWNTAVMVENPPLPAGSGTRQHLTIRNLVPGQKYYVAMTTLDEAGNFSGLSNIDSAEAAFSFIADVDDNDGELPHKFELAQNYPNPFNPSTTIEYSLPRAGYVRLSVFNVLGQEIAQLVNEPQFAGNYAVNWNAGNSDIASGIYFYRLQTESFTETKRMVLVK